MAALGGAAVGSGLTALGVNHHGSSQPAPQSAPNNTNDDPSLLPVQEGPLLPALQNMTAPAIPFNSTDPLPAMPLNSTGSLNFTGALNSTDLLNLTDSFNSLQSLNLTGLHNSTHPLNLTSPSNYTTPLNHSLFTNMSSIMTNTSLLLPPPNSPINLTLPQLPILPSTFHNSTNLTLSRLPLEAVNLTAPQPQQMLYNLTNSTNLTSSLRPLPPFANLTLPQPQGMLPNRTNSTSRLSPLRPLLPPSWNLTMPRWNLTMPRWNSTTPLLEPNLTNLADLGSLTSSPDPIHIALPQPQPGLSNLTNPTHSTPSTNLTSLPDIPSLPPCPPVRLQGSDESRNATEDAHQDQKRDLELCSMVSNPFTSLTMLLLSVNSLRALATLLPTDRPMTHSNSNSTHLQMVPSPKIRPLVRETFTLRSHPWKHNYQISA